MWVPCGSSFFVLLPLSVAFSRRGINAEFTNIPALGRLASQQKQDHSSSMGKRYPLRSLLKQAWIETIENRYSESLINSERGLQVYFCEALLRLFEGADRERLLFIEPYLKFEDQKTGRRPDLVICSGKLITGIVELKYCPRVNLRAESSKGLAKDIETLSFAVTDAGSLVLKNDRYRGKVDREQAFTLAKDAVLCWAGVYCGARVDIGSIVPKNRAEHFKDHYLQLDAITALNSKPSILPRARSQTKATSGKTDGRSTDSR
jgi:hypothetical protein